MKALIVTCMNKNFQLTLLEENLITQKEERVSILLLQATSYQKQVVIQDDVFKI